LNQCLARNATRAGGYQERVPADWKEGKVIKVLKMLTVLGRQQDEQDAGPHA
jgi:hypothetical protein